ncbi:hypothetical protein VTO58DRAFT_102862 [Aureobasidium pullulans]
MSIDPGMPELDTESQPYVLSAFIMLCRMFRSFSDASSGARLTADDLTLFNNQLLRVPTLTEHHNDLQKADLSVTQQWLRLMFWKLAINKVIMTANTNDDISSVFFPISLAKELLTNISAMSIDTLEAHGPGMELKLFEVTNSVADMITLNPRQTTSALEIGPQDILVHLATIIGRFRGGNKTLLPLLQSRLSDIGLDSLILPRCRIIRILFMVPLYAVASFLSALYYKQFAYFQIIGDTYAAIAITSFFALLCHYVGGTSEDQEAFFRDLVPGGWALYIFGFSIPLPVHWVCGKNMAKPSGSRWFKVVSYGVYQYAVVRILMAIVSVITQATDRYCPGSSSPAFAHLRTNIFNALSATIAQFPDHRPTFKFCMFISRSRAFIERIVRH